MSCYTILTTHWLRINDVLKNVINCKAALICLSEIVCFLEEKEEERTDI